MPGGGVTAANDDVGPRTGPGGGAAAGAEPESPAWGSALAAPFFSPRRAFRSLISLLCGRFGSDKGNLRVY